jgi:IS5 family transposase
MKSGTGDLFAQAHRDAKLGQFTGVLQRLDQLVDWAALAQAINAATGREGARPQGGRPGYPTVVLLKLIVLQQLHGNLSDEATEHALLDRSSWQRFTGLEHARELPDARTLWAFKNLLAHSAGGTQALFEQVQAQLAAAGLQARGGQIIDATLIEVPRSHVSPASRKALHEGTLPAHFSAKRLAHTDREARYTAKRGRWHYGYKAHVNVDQAHKLIRVLQVSAANVDDRTPLARLLDLRAERLQTGRTVYADKGYDAHSTRRLLKAQGLRDAVMRRDDPQRCDQSTLRRRNARLSPVRARVEHVFGSWQRTMGKQLRSIGLARAQAQIALQAVVYNLRRWVSLQPGSALASG